MAVAGAITRYSSVKHGFLSSLASDLRLAGIPARVKVRRNDLCLLMTARRPSARIWTGMLTAGRRRQLAEQGGFVRRMEESGLVELLPDGRDLAIGRIAPVLRVCATRKERDIVHYCRLLQHVPSGRRVGRQISALLLDEGQRQQRLIGAVTLASGVFSLGCRDKYLNWNGGPGRERRVRGLHEVMDLALCVAVPPYNRLFGGKLLALLAVTDPIVQAHRRKYGHALRGVITTCATGIHCPLFNRIMIRPGGLYRRIGETAGYTTVPFSTTTLKAGRILADAAPLEPSNWNPIRFLRKALRVCGVPPDGILRLGGPKGVYIAAVRPYDLEKLSGSRAVRGPDRLKHVISEGEAIRFWRDHLLARCATDAHTLRRVASARPESLLLTKRLPLPREVTQMTRGFTG
jgi:hypothetical protein